MSEKIVDQTEEEYAELIAYELSAKKWEELEAFEHLDQLHFPDVLHVRKQSGKFEQLKVCFRVPRSKDLRTARAEAKRIAAEDGIDQEKDKGQFDDLENACILWRALRSTSAPYEPLFIDVEELETKIDRDVQKLAWQKLEGYRRVIDLRPAAITRKQCLMVVAMAAKKRDISPLLVFDGPAQTACIVFMASLLQRFLTGQPSSQSSESSTPEPSA